MTHPGQPGTPPPTGGPQPGPQTPPAQPAAWGAMQPGAPQPGAPQPGAPQPGAQPFGGQPSGGWGRPGPGMPGGQGFPPGPGMPPPAAPAGRSRKARLGGAIGAVVIAGGVAVATVSGFGDPEVGDCVQPVGVSFETVDCDDAEARVRIIGVVDGEMSEAEFDADPNPCEDFPTATSALWQQEAAGTDGTVYCAEDI